MVYITTCIYKSSKLSQIPTTIPSPHKMRQSSSFYSTKKIVRDTYALHLKQLVGIDNKKMNLEKILSINFGQDAMIVVSKKQLVIYSIINMKVFFVREGFFWDAVFIPSTALAALVEHDGTQRARRTLKILSLEKNQFVATVTIKFQIERMKASQHCLCLAGISQICVIHFPSLKPIFHDLAGSGLGIIFDISFEGLTLAYQNQKKGFITIHNFSSISTVKARRKSTQVRDKIKASFISGIFELKQQPKKVIEIKSHHEYVSLIRLSPNGNRVATASQKGTMIRIFLTANGKLWQQLRVGYELCKVLDMSFYQQGNVISCLNEKGMVLLFNTKLQPGEEQAESQKRGYKIYEQANPKSIFSFLSFFYSNFGNQYPFSFFKLIKPDQISVEQNKQQKPIITNQEVQKKYMDVILQESEVQQKSEFQKREQFQELKEKQKEKQKVQSVQKVQVPQVQSPQFEKVHRSSSVSSSMSDTKNKKSKSLLKKLNILQARKDNYDYVTKNYNTIGRVFVGGNNFVWVVKGPYIFSLKYDPFNGGEMYHKETLKFC